MIAAASESSDLLLWDGGNNDFPFVRPGLHVVLADALRPGDETSHHPGEACLRMADVIVISKCDSAGRDAVERVRFGCRKANPRAPIVRGALPFRLENPEAVRNRRVLVVEDGPTITHGGMPHGAGLLAAQRAGVAGVVDPRDSAVDSVLETYRQYPHIGAVLPAVGYSGEDIRALRRTIESSDADVVVSATPVDLGPLAKPVVRVRYEFEDLDAPGLWAEVEKFLERRAA